MHMCSVIAPNQDITICLNNVWLMFNFSMGGFFLNYREVSQHSRVAASGANRAYSVHAVNSSNSKASLWPSH
jgi:hypothetical protein